MKRTVKILAATFTALVTAGCAKSEVAPSATDAPSEPSQNKRVIKVAGEYWAKHPDDYAGLARAIEDAGGDSIRFSFEKEGLQNLTGEQAQTAMQGEGEGEDETNNVTKDGVPVNAFKVGANWYHVQDQYGEWWNFNGTWNYRDDYIGAGAPDNAAGVTVDGMDEKCWRQDGDWMYAASYDNENHTNLTYRKEVDAKSSVWGIRDGTSGFKQMTDHGMLTLSFKRVGNGCNEKPAGKFYWEHNQDGSASGWSFSINLAIFSISYSDGSSGMTLQKSSGLTYRP